MTEKEDFTPQDYEDLIKELMIENEALKQRIAELENKDQVLESQEVIKKEVSIPIIETEKIEPVILVEEPIKEAKIEIFRKQKEIVRSKSTFSQDVTPLEMHKREILQGVSRRECPKCGNHNKILIRETIDRAHIISSYPRLYGKKYHCGQCGVEWRVPVEM
ncbi:MAG: hypothetical protein ACFE9Q_09170 [Candidatus Hodarchaeota archaeon]